MRLHIVNDWNIFLDCIVLISAEREIRGKSIDWCVHVEKNRHGHKISTWLELYEGACCIYGLYPTRIITQHIAPIFEVGCKWLLGSKSTIIYGCFSGIFRSVRGSVYLAVDDKQNLIKKKTERKRHWRERLFTDWSLKYRRLSLDARRSLKFSTERAQRASS